MRHKLLFSFFIFLIVALPIRSKDFVLTSGQTVVIACSPSEELVVRTALEMLGRDIQTVLSSTTQANEKTGEIVIGTVGQSELISRTGIDVSALKGKKQAFLLSVSPEGKLIVAGSDKHGTAYGILEISRLLGVSPWEWWADVTPEKKKLFKLSSKFQSLQAPSVEYRGIFINDEDWGLMPWSSRTYEPSKVKGEIGPRTNERIFELLLRLRANTYWPAMHECTLPFFLTKGNREAAKKYGIFIGASHCEPMACSAAGEWKRRGEGAYDYVNNAPAVYKFWEDRVKEVADQEILYTLGMRGVHDGKMQGAKTVEEQKAVIDRVFADQRGLIEKYVDKDVTKVPQVFIPYKEVLDIYHAGLQVPDDVTLMWCDDNYGYIRHFPTAEECARKGGNGVYYHVSYWGRPHDHLWLSTMSPYLIFQQMKLAYDRGIQKMWILNVGDIKPAEYQIELFMDMAWNPKQFNVSNLLDHPRRFCAQQFGEDQADEAMRILNLYSKYNGRVTGEMLDRNTYNLETGEWKQVSDEYLKLEAEALRQYISLKPEYKDAYKQLILFPVQAMANLYEMYYAQAMNHKLYKENNPQANEWADKVEQAFARDKALSDDYNNIMSGGKWKNMMIQKHIGYTSWNDNFPADTLPKIYRIENPEKAVGGYVFTGQDGYIAIEAEHYYSAKAAPDTEWTVIPYMGRTLSGMALMPYTQPTDGASISYKIKLPKGIDKVTVHVIVKSTLAFHDRKGHEYSIGFEGGKDQTINFNHNLNELPENVYSIYYPTVARRIVEKKAKLNVPNTSDGMQTITFKPLDPGIVLEKLVVDYGGYKKSYLFMNESKSKRESR